MTSTTIIYKKMDLDAMMPHEVAQVADLVIELANELGLPLSKPVIYRKVRDCIENQVGELYCMISNDTIVGMMGLVYSPEMWNDKICLTEISWYVKPEYRGRAGIYLIKEVEKNMKADKIRLGVGNMSLVKMLERMGYKQTKYILEKDF